jgi:hypothetical protein
MLSVLFLLLAPAAQAADLFCVAPFDETSRYEVTASLDADKSLMHFAYRAEDIDLETELEIKERAFAPKRSLRFVAENENMRIAGDSAFSQENYLGTLTVYFSLENVEPVEVEMICRIQ